MPRKFYTPYDALVANYGTNQNVVRFSYLASTWSQSELINSPPSVTALVSVTLGAVSIGRARVLKTSNSEGKVIPLTCVGGVWSVGTAVSLACSGNPANVEMSEDGLHALVGCDNSSNIGAMLYNESTGLWEANGYVTTPTGPNITSVAISSDGLMGFAIGKNSSTAYPLARDPGTNVWSIGTGVSVGSSNDRFLGISISRDKSVVVIGSDYGAADSDVLIWSGTSWVRSAITQAFGMSRWLLDGRTILATSGNSAANAVYVLDYDSDAGTITRQKTISIPHVNIWGLTVPIVGRQDIALATSFNDNKLIPLSLTSSGWTAGTSISSGNFSSPLSTVMLPVI